MGVEPGGLVGRARRPQLSQEVLGGSRVAGRATGGAPRVLTTPEVHLLLSPVSPFSLQKGESVDGWMGGWERGGDRGISVGPASSSGEGLVSYSRPNQEDCRRSLCFEMHF